MIAKSFYNTYVVVGKEFCKRRLEMWGRLVSMTQGRKLAEPFDLNNSYGLWSVKTKKKRIKPRNYLVPIMRLGRKAAAFVDRKKEEFKRRCRKRVSETED